MALRKISNLKDANHILKTLMDFRDSLDEDDPETTDLIGIIQNVCTKLQVVNHTPFSSIDYLHLTELKIRPEGLEIKPDGRARAEDQGSTEKVGNWMTMENTIELLRLVRGHVSPISEAGCRILINVILLRVASVNSGQDIAISIVPEYPILKTLLDTDHSFSGVVVLTRLPSKFTNQILEYPNETLGRSEIMKVGTLNIFEAKNLEAIRDGIPQAVLTAATWCQRNKMSCTRGAVTSGERWVFFTYEKLGKGGVYRCTPVISLREDLGNLTFILGILRDWIENAANPQQEYFDVV